MLSYALRNAAHYRAKYASAFGLICAIAFLLSLSLFMLRGVERESAKFARGYGDVQLSSLDAESTKTLAAGVQRHFGDSGLAEKWIGITGSPGGTAFNARGQWFLRAYQMEEMRPFGKIQLTDGQLPGDGEAALPANLKKRVALGETFTYVFKTADLVLDSRKLRVSGFYVPFSQFRDSGMLVARRQFLDMNPTLDVPNVYYVYLAGHGGDNPKILGDAEFKALKDGIIAKFKAGGSAVGLWANSIDRFRQSSQFISLFLAISVIFIAVLVIIAAMTIVNVLFLAVLDRIRIIASFMAFGMTKDRAVLLLSCELLAFALAASLLGILASAAASPLLPRARIDMDNWVVYMLLGDSKRLCSLPNLPDALLTLAVGTAFPFVTAVFAIRKLLKGQLAQLLNFKK